MQNVIIKGLISGAVPVGDGLTSPAQDHAVCALSRRAAAYYISDIQCSQNENLLLSAECENCAVRKRLQTTRKTLS